MQAPVVYIITKLELGGAQKVCLSLFKEVAQERQTFLISGTEGVLAASVQGDPSAILLPSFTREVGAKTMTLEIKNFFNLLATLKKLKRQHPDLIVHTHSTKAGIIGRWAAFFAGIKHRVHTIHGFAFHEHQSRLTTACIYGAELLTSFITNHFVCVSEKDVRLGRRLFPRFAKKHTLIRAAVDRTPFLAATVSTPAREIIFGTIACFKPQKNLPDLIKAFAQVHQKVPHARLEIIGDGVMRHELEALIAHLHLEHVVTLHGWQQHVAPFMARWHAFTLSSLWEGLPCAIIEARLMKLPVLAYDTGGISEVIKTGKNGMICAQKQWQSLADAMTAVATDPELYAALRDHPDNLLPFFQETMIEQHQDLYRRLKK